jgi:hypothetical protein
MVAIADVVALTTMQNNWIFIGQYLPIKTLPVSLIGLPSCSNIGHHAKA